MSVRLAHASARFGYIWKFFFRIHCFLWIRLFNLNLGNVIFLVVEQVHSRLKRPVVCIIWYLGIVSTRIGTMSFSPIVCRVWRLEIDSINMWMCGLRPIRMQRCLVQDLVSVHMRIVHIDGIQVKVLGVHDVWSRLQWHEHILHDHIQKFHVFILVSHSCICHGIMVTWCRFEHVVVVRCCCYFVVCPCLFGLIVFICVIYVIQFSGFVMLDVVVCRMGFSSSW